MTVLGGKGVGLMATNMRCPPALAGCVLLCNIVS